MEPTEHDPIARRLHSLGGQPIDPEVVASHRSLMASVPVAPSRSRLRPLMVGSLLAGSLFGGMGLAAAAPGVPDAASNVAKTVLARVTLGAVDDPDEDKAKDTEAKAAAQEAKTARTAAKAARTAAKAANHPAGTHGVTRSTVGCPAGFTGNHGQYVSSVAKTPGVTEAQKSTAAESDCGKPVQSVHPESSADTATKENSGKSDTDHGKPDASVRNGQSGAEHPGDQPNEKAFDSVAAHRKATAGRSAGHGPTTTTTVVTP